MGLGKAWSAARMGAAATGAVALVAASPGVAQAAPPETTRYDGDATALRIEGLRLELLPHGTNGLPEQLAPLARALEQIREQAPEQLRRDRLTLAMPDQVIGHAEFPGVDTQAAIPSNPLLTARVLPARSVEKRNGDLVSEAGVADLSLAGGVLTADLIKTQCVGDGESVALDVTPLQLNSNQHIVRNEVELPPGRTVRIAGLGTVTYNQADTDGSTFADATNLVIDLDSDLSLDALLGVFDTTVPSVRRALTRLLIEVGETRLGPSGEQPLKQVLNKENLGQIPADQFEDGVRDLVQPVRDGSQQIPRAAREALNNVAHLAGTVTIANAACSQATVTQQAPQPQQQPQQAVPAQPVADTSRPPLADTGSPAGMVGIGLAGVAALLGGGFVLLRLRRNGA